MKNSKLIELLRTFSAKERRSFRDMAASSYFNRNQDVTRLADWLDTFAPEYSGATRAGAQAFLFPEEVPDEARLNHLMSFLLKLAENFVGLEIYQNNTFPAGLDMLQAFSDRGLDKHYHFQLEKLRRELDAEAMPDTSFFYNVYAVEILEAQRTALRSPRQFNAGVQKATDHLDTFYLLEKLKRTCYMYTSQAILATPYNLHLVEEICRFAGAHLSEMPTPAIEAYYRIFQLLSKPEADEDFAALKALLAARAQEFNQEDLTDVYQYAINHCNIQIMKARESYVQEAFDLYVESVSSGVLLENRILSPWHFKNIINLGLKLKKYAWTEAFIESHTQLLAPEFQPDALHYNLALLYYSTGRHDDALLHLNRVEYSDIHYSTGAKVMLCQIYFQNDDIDALESLIHAFNTYLRRNRLISENVRQVYLNFILIMRKVMRARPQQYPAIAQEVQKMRVLAAKDWLLKILGESS